MNGTVPQALLMIVCLSVPVSLSPSAISLSLSHPCFQIFSLSTVKVKTELIFTFSLYNCFMLYIILYITVPLYCQFFAVIFKKENVFLCYVIIKYCGILF